MKKNFKNYLVALFAAVTITLASCAKEGCTDPDSVNYDPKATKSDGTCRFEGTNVIWFGKTTSVELENDGATTLFYYVDGKLVGSTSTSVFWSQSPDCGSTGSITIKKDLGGLKTGTSSYSIKDQTDFEYWSGTLDFKANTCTATELVW